MVPPVVVLDGLSQEEGAAKRQPASITHDKTRKRGGKEESERERR